MRLCPMIIKAVLQLGYQVGYHITKQAESAEFVTVLKSTIPLLIKLVDLQGCKSTALKDLWAEHSEFHIGIDMIIYQVVKLLAVNDFDIQSATIQFLAAVAEYPEFHFTIKRAIIPQLIELLKTNTWHVEVAIANTLSKFAEHCDLQSRIREIIPHFIAWAHSITKDYLLDSIPFNVHDIDFGKQISAISHRRNLSAIMNTLGSDQSQMLHGALYWLFKINKWAQNGHAPCSYHIATLIQLLEKDRFKAQVAAANSLSTLAGYKDFHSEIIGIIPRFVHLLTTNVKQDRDVIVNMVYRFAKHTEFHNEIIEAIPQVIQSLKDNNPSSSSYAAGKTLSILAEHKPFANIIMRDILQLIELLKNEQSS
ncbi:armadillo-type protein [Gautieria morchelliformis]|nr:armadillo-type protein [Gautieria morchelliformis]